MPVFETVKTNVNVEKDFTPEDYKHLERFGELGPNVLARLAKNASRNELIVEQYIKNRGTYGSTIVFAADTLHAQTLAEEFKKKGVDADYVDYSRDDAQEVIHRYQEKKKPDVLVNVEMLTEGFDAPHTRTVFIARPTRSEGLLAQMVGRALRGKQSGGNDKAYLVTFLDTWEEFDVLDAEYVLSDALDVEKEAPEVVETQRIPIPLELVREKDVPSHAEQHPWPARRRVPVPTSQLVRVGRGLRGRHAASLRHGVRQPDRAASCAPCGVPGPGVGARGGHGEHGACAHPEALRGCAGPPSPLG